MIGEDGKLTWKTLEDIGAGDGNDNTTYEFKFENQKIIITPKENGVAQDNIELDLADFITANELGEVVGKAAEGETAATGLYKAIADGVQEAKNYADANDTNTTYTMTYGDNDDGSKKVIRLIDNANSVISEIDASVFIADGVLNDVSYDADNDKLIFVWNIIESVDDEGNPVYKTVEVDVKDLVDTYTAGNGLELTEGIFSIKRDASSEDFLTIGADGIKVSGIQDAIDDAKQAAIDDAAGKYATTGALTQLETDLDARLDTLEAIDHTTYATKTELKATDDVAKDAQSRVGIVEGKIDEITSVGGEPNVVEKIKVNGVTLEVEKDAEGKSTKSVNIPVPTKFSDIEDDSGFDARITAAQTKANDAATAASNAQATADANAQNIQTNSNDISNLKTLTGEHTTKISALELADSTHAGEFRALSETVTTHGTDIAGLKTGKADTTVTDALAGRITTNENAIKTLNETTLPALDNRKANAADVYTKTEIGTIEADKTLVDMINDAKSEASYDDTEVRGLITDNANAIAAIYKVDGETKSGVLVDEITRVEGLVNTEKTRAEGVESGLNTRLETVEAFWKEAIRDEDEKNVIDTLKEIQDYIVSDETGAAAMAASIKANEDAIKAIYTPASGEGDEAVAASGILVTEVARLDKAIADNSTADKKYTDDAIAALQASIHGVDDDTIKLSENKAYVAKVSTDILAQGSQELVFSAGNASGYNTQA